MRIVGARNDIQGFETCIKAIAAFNFDVNVEVILLD
jgi:hypothetical protein